MRNRKNRNEQGMKEKEWESEERKQEEEGEMMYERKVENERKGERKVGASGDEWNQKEKAGDRNDEEPKPAPVQTIKVY